MTKKLLFIIGLILLVAGCVVSYFAEVPQVTVIAIAGEALGLALTIAAAYSAAEKKTWKTYVTLICVPVGALLLGFAGMAKDTMTILITSVIGLVALIIGLIPVFLVKRE